MATENIDIRVSEDGSRVVRRRLDDIADGANRTHDATERMVDMLRTIGKYLAVTEVMRWADAWSVASSSIKIATSNSYEFVQVQSELFKIAQRSRQEFGALAELYAAVARQSENLQTSQKGLLLYTENISKALAIQHTSMQAARGPLLQLGQAMASGTIRAQEFNSIMLGLPYVMKIVAENFKGGAVSVMQLRQMMLQGKLESREFFEAFQRGSEQINKDFDKTQVTFSQAFTIFKNELIKFTGTMDSTTGAATKFAAVLKFVAENITLLSLSLAALYLGTKFGPIIAGFLELRAASAKAAAEVTAANMAMAASEQAAAVASMESARAQVAKTQADLANVAATQAAIVISREAAIATLAKANSDILAARASIQAATNAGALSFALAVKREAEVALTAAEVARSAALSELAILGQQQARVTVIQTEATAAQTAAVRALAVAQGMGAEAAAAYGIAQTGAAAATARVGIAAGAATVASRLFTGAVALMGGPIGATIALLAGLAMWLFTVKSRADDARSAIEAVNRVNAAKAGGPGVRQSDAEKIQAAYDLARKEQEKAEDALANFEKNLESKRSRGYNKEADELSTKFGKAFRDDVERATEKVKTFGKAMEEAKDLSIETGGAAGKAARELGNARAAWEQSNKGVKTATGIQEAYKDELEASRKAHKSYIEQLRNSNTGGVNDKEIERANRVQAEAEKSMEKERDAAMKRLNNLGSATKKQIQLDVDERMSLIQTGLDNELSIRNKAYESEKRMLDAKHQNGMLSESQFMAENLQMVQRYEQEEKAIIEKASADQLAAYEQRRAYIQKTLEGKRETDELKKLDAEYAKFVDSVNAKLAKLDTSAFERQSVAIYKLNGDIAKLAKQDEQYWRQASANADKDEAVAEAKRKLAFATEEQQAAYEAFMRTGEQHNAQLARLEDAYNNAQREADDFSDSIDWREAGADTIAILEAMNNKADDFGARLAAAYGKLDELKNRAAASAAESVRNREFNKNVNDVADAIETAIFEGGKAGGKKFSDWMKNYFLRNPIRVLLQGALSIVGNALGFGGGAGGAAGGAGGVVGTISNGVGLINAGRSAYTLGSQWLGGTMSGANVLGTGFANATGTGIDGLLATNGAYGTAGAGGGLGGGMSGMWGGGVFAAVAAVVLNALGAFRSERRVGSGLRGTLGGGGEISPWEEWREGGTLFSGPNYSTHNPVEELRRRRARLQQLRDSGQGNTQAAATEQMIVDDLEKKYGAMEKAAAAQSKVLQTAFDTMKTNVVKMAEVLGLSTEAVKGFTTQLGGSDKGLNFEGLNDTEIQAKITEALDTANNELAQQVIGTWVTTNETISRIVTHIQGTGEDAVTTYETVSEVVTETTYVASEYAREGEKAIDTLTRLANSLSIVNQVLNTLGLSAYEASLAGADLASKLIDLFGSADAFVSATNAYYSEFYTEEERRAAQTRQITEELKKYNIAMPKTREEYRKLVESQDLNTEEGRKMWAMLVMLAPAFADITEAAEDVNASMDKIRETTDKAFASLESAINREISALEQSKAAVEASLQKATEIFNMLDAAFKNLMGSIESATKQTYEKSRAYITAAIANPNKPLDKDELSSAIAGIDAGLSPDNFKSKIDYDRERLTIAGQYDKLRAVAKAQMTVEQQILEGINIQITRLTDMLKMAEAQLDQLRGIDNSVMSVAQAILNFQQAWANEAAGVAPPTGPAASGGSSGVPVAGPNPYQSRVSYGADEALTSFEKFKAWYVGLKVTADPTKMTDGGYDTPDWMRIGGNAADNSDSELFGAYTFYKNNPRYAQDYEKIMTTGRSGESTDGSGLVRSDLSKMPADAAEYFSTHQDELLSYEGFGVDPVLAYRIYRDGPEKYGIDPKTTNISEYLRSNKWTPNGIVKNDNVKEMADLPYKDMKLARWELSSGNIIDIDGRVYTPDGRPLGQASREQMVHTYGQEVLDQNGYNGESQLYNTHMKYGYTREQYYTSIKQNLDKAMQEGRSAQWIADAIASTGASMKDVAAAYGITPSQLRENLSNAGATSIPAFANGGLHTGGLRVVGERGWELEATGASRIWNQSQLGAALAMGLTDGDDDGDLEMVSTMANMSQELDNIRRVSYSFGRSQTVALRDMLKLMKKNDNLGMPPTRSPEDA